MELSLDLEQRPARVGRVHDAFAGEALREQRMVGDVVHVAQEHRAHTAQGLEAVHQRTRGARRIDEDVAALGLGPSLAAAG